MAKKKSTQRRGRFYSLGVTYNPETREMRVPAYFYFGRDQAVDNPILGLIDRESGEPPPRGKPTLTVVRST